MTDPYSIEGIVWEDPPSTAIAPGGKPGKYAKIAVALRQNPGKWAKIPGTRTEQGAQNFAQNLRRGKMKGYENAEWETRIEGTQIWARFVKEKPAEEVQSPPPGEVEDDDTVPETESGYLIRAWGRSHGWPDLPDRGRLPRAVVEAYHAREPDHTNAVRV